MIRMNLIGVLEEVPVPVPVLAPGLVPTLVPTPGLTLDPGVQVDDPAIIATLDILLPMITTRTHSLVKDMTQKPMNGSLIDQR